MIFDEWEGAEVCENCGLVKSGLVTLGGIDFGSDGRPMGVIVGEHDSGSATAWGSLYSKKGLPFQQYSYADKCKRQVVQSLTAASARLKLSTSQTEEAQALIERATDGRWGGGHVADVLMAACLYATARIACLPVSIIEVADAAQCDIYEVGGTFRRLCQALSITVPPVDPKFFIARAMSSISLFKGQQNLSRQVADSCHSLLEFSRRQGLLIGRHAPPVTAAALTIAAQANKVAVLLLDVCVAMRCGMGTASFRYRELQARLIEVGRELPWGRDIKLSKIQHYLPFLLKHVARKNKIEDFDQQKSESKISAKKKKIRARRRNFEER